MNSEPADLKPPPVTASLRRPLLWLALGSFLALSLGYLFSTPVFEAPDEPAHYQYAFYLATTGKLPLVKGAGEIHGRPSGEEQLQGYHPPLYYGLLALTMHLLGHADTAAAPLRNEEFGRWRDDPPGLRLMYRHGFDERSPVSAEVRMFRWLRGWSVLFGLLTLLLIHRIALLAFPGRPLLADAAALVAGCMPKWTFIFSALNNDNLAALLCHVVLLGLVTALVTRRLSAWRGVSLGLFAGLSIMAKMTGLFLLPVLAVVYGLALLRWRDRRGEVLRSGLLVLLMVLLVAGWFFVRNQLIYGSPMALDVHADTFERIQVKPGAAWQWISRGFLPKVFQSFVGHFGWNILAPLPWLVTLMKGVVGAALLGWLVLLIRPARAGGGHRGVSLLLLGVALLVFALTLRYNLLLKGPYARYLFPSMAALAILLVAGLARLGQWLPARPRRALFALLLLVPPGVGGHVLIRQFRPVFRVELAPAPAHHAVLVGSALSEVPSREIELLSPAAGAVLEESPVFRWQGQRPDALMTLHMRAGSGRLVGMTWEQGRVELRDGRFGLPPGEWERVILPGESYSWTVRQVPDRSLGESVQEMPASTWRTFRRSSGP